MKLLYKMGHYFLDIKESSLNEFLKRVPSINLHFHSSLASLASNIYSLILIVPYQEMKRTPVRISIDSHLDHVYQ